MIRKSAVMVLSAVLCTSVQATSVFSPTDTNVNFIQLLGMSNALIGLFDDSDVGFTGDYLAIHASGFGDQVYFTPSGSDYLLTNASNQTPVSMTLSGSNYFTLAAWSPLMAAWVGLDAAYCSQLSASCTLYWPMLPLVELVVDIKQVEPVMSTIPLPTSFALFACGAMGLALVGRRRVINTI